MATVVSKHAAKELPATVGTEQDLPEGWACPLVRDVLDVRYGKGLPERNRKDGPYAVYGSNGVVGHHDEPLTAGPTIILGRKGTVGAVHYSRQPCWPIDTTYFVEEVPGLDTGFLYYALSTLGLSEMDTSSAIPGLNREDVYAQVLPLAPLAEQKRIVAKVEALVARVNAARERLAKVPTILKRFRQSVLAAACSGRLTQDWREQHVNAEDGYTVLNRIATLRGTEPPEAHALPPGDMPATWAWTTFGYVIGELRNGISTRPAVEPPGNPILRISAARSGKVLLDDLRYLPDSDHLVDTYSVRDGDLLFTRYNGSIDLLGVCGMVRGVGRKTVLYPDKLMRVRFDHQEVLPAFAEIFFQGPEARERLMGEAKSSAGQQGVSGKDIKTQAFALPPGAEQKEIVCRVEALFGLADSVEKRVAAAAKRAERLNQAILAKAFRGELVPTEADLARREGREYEPACVLLERIRSERCKQAATARPHSRRLSGARRRP